MRPFSRLADEQKSCAIRLSYFLTSPKLDFAHFSPEPPSDDGPEDGVDANLAPELRPRTAAWYAKAEPSFSDVIALVRRRFWVTANLSVSRLSRDTVEIPAALLERLTGAPCYAA